MPDIEPTIEWPPQTKAALLVKGIDPNAIRQVTVTDLVSARLVVVRAVGADKQEYGLVFTTAEWKALGL